MKEKGKKMARKKKMVKPVRKAQRVAKPKGRAVKQKADKRIRVPKASAPVRPSVAAPVHLPVAAPVASKARRSEAPMPKTSLKKQELDAFRQVLLGVRDGLSGRIASLRGESLVRTEDINTGEDGTEAFDRQFALELAGSEQNVLLQIDDAIRRIDERTYGICEGCKKRIEKMRLRALPFVKLCVACQSLGERGRPRFLADISAD